MRFRHIGIVVSDIKKSIYFYRDLLGLSIEKDRRESGEYIDRLLNIRNGDIRIIKLTDITGAPCVELLHYHNPLSGKTMHKKINDIGCSHFALSVDNIDRLYRRLKKRGIKFINPPQVSPGGYAKVAFCNDPDGVFIELVEVLDG